MARTWDASLVGVLQLPSGRFVRGRGLRRPLADDELLPEFGLYLLSHPPDRVSWGYAVASLARFRLPADQDDARDGLLEAWRRAENERVEIACDGGNGRTGTPLACLAVLDGLSALEAVGFVRAHYAVRAVETPWQRRYVTHFRAM